MEYQPTSIINLNYLDVLRKNCASINCNTCMTSVRLLYTKRNKNMTSIIDGKKYVYSIAKDGWMD